MTHINDISQLLKNCFSGIVDRDIIKLLYCSFINLERKKNFSADCGCTNCVQVTWLLKKRNNTCSTRFLGSSQGSPGSILFAEKVGDKAKMNAFKEAKVMQEKKRNLSLE